MNYKIFKEGANCKVYNMWLNMIERAYCDKYHKRYPTYKSVEVCKDWFVFSNFHKWVSDQDVEGKVLDKDIKQKGIKNKIYSPDTCLFIHPFINRALSHKNLKRTLPVGVEKSRERYRARMSYNGKYLSLGTYDTAKEAHKVFLSRKREYIQELVETYEPRPDVQRLILDMAYDLWK